jgi:hypothetical protein
MGVRVRHQNELRVQEAVQKALEAFGRSAGHEYEHDDRLERMSHSTRGGWDFDRDLTMGLHERHSMSCYGGGGVGGGGGGGGRRGGGGGRGPGRSEDGDGIGLLDATSASRPLAYLDDDDGSASGLGASPETGEMMGGRSEIAQHNVVSRLVHADRNGDARTRALCMDYLCVRASEEAFLTALKIAQDDKV